jgi:hypothetical protein
MQGEAASKRMERKSLSLEPNVFFDIEAIFVEGIVEHCACHEKCYKRHYECVDIRRKNN